MQLWEAHRGKRLSCDPCAASEIDRYYTERSGKRMTQEIPPALQQQFMRFDKMQHEHETMQVMVQSMQSELSEVRMTLEELGKQADDVETYKVVGQVMFRVDKPKMTEELDNRRQTLEMRLAAMSKKLETQAEKLKELATKIQDEAGKLNIRLQ